MSRVIRQSYYKCEANKRVFSFSFLISAIGLLNLPPKKTTLAAHKIEKEINVFREKSITQLTSPPL